MSGVQGQRSKELEIRRSPVSQPEDQSGPTDGGAWAWLVCLASFWTNGSIFGVMNCFGVLYVNLEREFSQESDGAASFRTAWVGSVSIGTTFLLSPVASILTDKFGAQRTAFSGGLMATLGMLVSAYVRRRPELLYLTYGVALGAGASLAYTPSLVILGHYFSRRLGLVNGLVTAGSSVFTMVMPLLLRHLLDTAGVKVTLQVLSGMTGAIMLCALTFRPRLPPPEEDLSLLLQNDQKPSCCRKFFARFLSVSIWQNRRYVLWVFAIPVALFGYFVPYVHLVKHVETILPENQGEYLVMCIGLTSGVGRIVFGKIADFKRVNRIHLQQISFLSIGILTMLLVVAKQFPVLIIMCLFLGLFDGCFISLLGPIAFDIVGPQGASQAIGFLLGFCSIPLTIGPPIAGLMYDHLHNYKAAFLTAGVPPMLGAALMCLIHRVPHEHCHRHCHHHCPHHNHHPGSGGADFLGTERLEEGPASEKQSLVQGCRSRSSQSRDSQAKGSSENAKEEIIWERRDTSDSGGQPSAALRSVASVFPAPGPQPLVCCPHRLHIHQEGCTGRRLMMAGCHFPEAPPPETLHVPVKKMLCLLERESSV